MAAAFLEPGLELSLAACLEAWLLKELSQEPVFLREEECQRVRPQLAAPEFPVLALA